MMITIMMMVAIITVINLKKPHVKKYFQTCVKMSNKSLHFASQGNKKD